MPRAKKRVQPIAPAPPDAQLAPLLVAMENPDNLPVIYPTVEITERSIISAAGPLTVEYAIDAMGWQTEKEFQQFNCAADPTSKPAHWLYGDDYHCKNLAGEKVRTIHNAHNRAFDMSWCEDLIHTILHGQWAGPYTVPGETVNGETVRISRYGRVLSGQHQMTALILADEWLTKARNDLGIEAADRKYPMWALSRVGGYNRPFIECITVKGLSEDPRIIMTVDYVKPRTAADVFYTSSVFKDATPPNRKELCRLLATATDLLWTRTATSGYRTHVEVCAFLERHKRLLKCVEHLYAENSARAERKISKLRLSAGSCAALMYLMGSSGPRTDGDVYRNEEPAPSEKNLDWVYWERAESFWTLLANGRDFLPVRLALGRLMDSSAANEENQGLGGRVPEKFSILAKAWAVWKRHADSAGAPFSNADMNEGGSLALSYIDLDAKSNKLPDGQLALIPEDDFGGIDCALTSTKPRSGGAPMPPPPTREEIARASEEARRRRK